MSNRGLVVPAGIFGLLLSLLVWGPLDRRRNHHGGFARWVPLGALACLAWRFAPALISTVRRQRPLQTAR